MATASHTPPADGVYRRAEPRPCITGYQPTFEPGKPVPALAPDWLSVTFHSEDALAMAETWFGPGEAWTPLQRGLNGYRHGVECGHRRIFWGGMTDAQGIPVATVQASGQGCREMVERGVIGPDGWPAFFASLLELPVTVPRVDFAQDDTGGRISVEKMLSFWERGHVVTRVKTCESTRNIGKRDVVGEGLYFGKRGSPSSLVVYNKRLERIQKGHPDPGMMTRVEMRYANRRALSAVEAYSQYGPRAIAADVWRFADFKHPGKDRNRSRWDTADWWAAFLGDCERGRMLDTSPDTSEEARARWMRNTCASAVAAEVAAHGWEWYETTFRGIVRDALARKGQAPAELLSAVIHAHTADPDPPRYVPTAPAPLLTLDLLADLPRIEDAAIPRWYE